MEIFNCTECVNASRCFKKLLPEQLDFVNHNKAQIVFSKGETICKKGAFANTISYIVDGLVKVYLEGPQGKKLGVFIMKGEDFIGLTSLYGTENYYYTASAITDTRVCQINKESITDLIAMNSRFAAEIIKWYCRNYGLMFDKLDSFGFKQLNGRVADVLLYLEDISYREKSIHHYLTRKDFAEMVGIPVGSAIRILSELNDSHLIKMDKKIIEILDRPMLEKISRGG